jgi:chitinase
MLRSVVALATLISACSLYDPSLIAPRGEEGGGNGSIPDAALEAGGVVDTGAYGDSPGSSTADANEASSEFVFYRAIDIGGKGGVIDGQTWESGDTDAGYYTTAPYTTTYPTPGALIPPVDATKSAMIHSACSGPDYEIDLEAPKGTYQVFLYVWENDNPVTFNVSVENQEVGTGLSSGMRAHWSRLGPWTTTIVDDAITVRVWSAADGAMVSGLEVWKKR